jgi:addiction module HigA family antidote
LIITEEQVMANTLRNIHPGEILLEEFLKPYGLSQNRIARDIGVPPRRINEVVLGKRSVTADTALRLARYFEMSESFWMGLQADYDLEETRRRLGGRLDTEVHPHAA